MNFPFGLMEHIPNLHPLVVHFPLALLPLALVFDLFSLLLRRHLWLDRTAAALYLLGAGGAAAAYFTGKQAEETLPHIPPAALVTLADHADWALWTVWIVIPLALLRLAVAWLDRGSPRLSRLPVRSSLLLVAAVGNGFLVITADRGGEAVFGHGVGVAAVRQAEPAPPEAAPDAEGLPEERLTRRADGSLHWAPLAADGGALGTILAPAPGSPAETVRWTPPEPDTDVEGLALAVSGPALLFLPGEFEDVQVDVHLDLSEFEGRVGVVHHGRDFDNFEAFVLYPDGEGVLERREKGEIHPMDRGEGAPRRDRIVHLTVSAAGRHFYGRIDGRMVAHGHAPPWGPGRCGLFFDGSGLVRVISVTVTPV